MICDFKEEMAWHRMRKVWVRYTQRYHCVPGYPVLVPFKWNKVVSEPGWSYSSLEPSWHRCSGLCAHYICALESERLAPAGPRPVNSWGQPSLMPGKGSPGSPRPLHPLPTVVWEMMERQLPKCPATQMCSFPGVRAAQLPGLSQSPQGASALSRALPVMAFTMDNGHKICCCLR